MKNKVGRPKIEKPIKELNLSSFRQDIKIFKNSLIDSLQDEEQDKKETIQKFLDMPSDVQNIFIIYLIKDVTINELAKILDCDRTDLWRIIVKTKKDLKL